jgi:hypothetical protein
MAPARACRAAAIAYVRPVCRRSPGAIKERKRARTVAGRLSRRLASGWVALVEAPVVMRRLLGPVLAALLVLPAAAAAEPARDTPAKLTKTLTGVHSVLHYTDAAGDPDALTPARAQTLLNALEVSAAKYKELGYTILNDGDGKVDAYVFDRGHTGGSASQDVPIKDQNTGWINLTANASELAAHHEMFHIVQYGMRGSLSWMIEPGAVWAETFFSLKGRSRLAASGISLDCYSATDKAACGGDARAYGRWPFFTSLAMDQGPGFLDAYAKGRSDADLSASRIVPSLDAALRARGTTLSTTYLRATERLLTNELAPGGRVTVVPTVGTLRTGVAAGEEHAADLTVNHLAAHFVELRGGLGEADACKPAQLRVLVTAPAGVPTRPVLDRRDYQADPVPIAVPKDGGTGEVTIPWETCAEAAAIVALPNASLGLDGQPFNLKTQIVSVEEPPAPTPTPTPRPRPEPVTDERPPALRALLATGRTLTGRTSEPAQLTIRIRRGGVLLATVRRGVSTGRFRVRLPKVAVKKPQTTVQIVATDAAGNAAAVKLKLRR